MECLNMQVYSHVVEIYRRCNSFLEAGLSVGPMGESDDDSKKITTSAEMENLCLGISSNRFSRDFLQRFMGGGSEHEKAKEDDEGVELNLGLSLGGRFGVEKSSMNLVRSTSVASCLPLVRDDNDAVAPLSSAAAYAGLVRTSSLPVETEEEWRKRKKLQNLRRMEAKRRRSEKQRNLKEGGGSGSHGKLSLEEISCKGKGLGSMESKRGTSLEGSSGESLQEGSNHDIASNTRERTSRATAGSETETPSKRPDSSRTQGREIPTTSMDDMPCVFTVGDGPNGRRVDGILYRYGKREEVRIMCICHGSFHSPAEFVKHAGGTDVDHPLKHIVINRNSPSLL
ncbi:Ninja-family protein AFP2 [Sesamum alatum]|uniref:Ninja-family protein n=1 Tax=Sesamum alatum TaxID=300844 RepID=A0AAE1Y589_9LAMI|nr:Ninja-family protein AFP2 [Sesamum alatum]